MGLFDKFLKTKSAAVVQAAAQKEHELDKKISKDLIEGVIAGSLYISYKDGDCDDSEVASLCALLEAEDAFAPWASEVPLLIEKYSKMMRAGMTYARVKVMKELNDLRNTGDVALCFACIETVAQQGDVSDVEKEGLKEIAAALGVAYRG